MGLLMIDEPQLQLYLGKLTRSLTQAKTEHSPEKTHEEWKRTNDEDRRSLKTEDNERSFKRIDREIRTNI